MSGVEPSRVVAPVEATRSPRVYLLLPAYNEEESLRQLLPKALAVEPPLSVIVVDDGSSDDTAAIVRDFAARSNRVEMLEHGDNRGLGEAIRTLLSRVLEVAGEDDVAVTMDADNTMNPSLIPAMLEELKRADIVIASRFAGGCERGVSAFRRLCSRGARWFLRLLLRVEGVRDYTCGYRAVRVSLLRRLRESYPPLLDSSGFTSTAELLFRLARFDPRIVEVPLDLRYDEKGSLSKMRVLRTISEYFWLVARLRASR